MRTPCSSTVVTKLLPAFTSHRTTALISLNPKVAFRTLLKLGSLHKVNKLFVVLIETVGDSILSTGHTRVVGASALQAIVL